jgi:phosphatidate cytidylyltransferase
MLKQRVITAVILGAILVFAIFKLPNPVLEIILALVTLIGAWEWSVLVGIKKSMLKILYVALIGVAMLFVWHFIQPQYENTLLMLVSLWWAGVVILLALYKSAWQQTAWLKNLLLLSGFIVLVPAWLALTSLHDQGPEALMFFFALIWVADIAAYFVGKRFGKNKLAPKLSPGKSREGVLGALLASVVMAIIGLQMFTFSKQASLYFIGLCVLTALISVVGDLYESLLKRNAGVKDSGTILPGHGGVLDRVDSITAAAPGYLLGLYWVSSC